MKRIVLLAIWVSAMVFGCGGGGAPGDACTTEGSVSECEGGAICGKDDQGQAICLQTCVEKQDCPSGYDCEGVENSSTKGCRPGK